MNKPVCEVCGDSHVMQRSDRPVPCTHCPTPCDKCRAGGTGAYCETPRCLCLCHCNMKPADPVANPGHYHRGSGHEAIDVIEAWGLGFCLGNAIKYIARHELKGRPLEDLKKARWYLDRAIVEMERSR